MLNYLVNQNFNNYTNSYIKQQKHKKNYISTSQISKKQKISNKDFSKTELHSSLFKIKTPIEYNITKQSYKLLKKGPYKFLINLLYT